MATVPNQNPVNKPARPQRQYRRIKTTTAHRTCGETYDGRRDEATGIAPNTTANNTNTVAMYNERCTKPFIGDADGHTAASFDCATAGKTNARFSNKHYTTLTSTNAGGHTASNAPDLFRPPMRSGAGPVSTGMGTAREDFRVLPAFCKRNITKRNWHRTQMQTMQLLTAGVEPATYGS